MLKPEFRTQLQLLWLVCLVVYISATSFNEHMKPNPRSGPEYNVIEEEFKRACLFAREQKKVDQEDKLRLYGLFKCATVGVCNTTSPSIFQVSRTHFSLLLRPGTHSECDSSMCTRKEHLLTISIPRLWAFCSGCNVQSGAPGKTQAI
jgi:hypothetical protein